MGLEFLGFGQSPELDAFYAGVWFFVAAMVYGYLSKVEYDGGPSRWERWRAAWLMSRSRGARPEPASVQNHDDRPSSERTNERANAGSEAFIPPEPARTLGSAFVLTSAELDAVRAMAHHRETVIARGEVPTKSGSVLAGFGVKRGGTDRYLRASTIYDALYAPAESAPHFPNMTPEQKQARDVLGLNKTR